VKWRLCVQEERDKFLFLVVFISSLTWMCGEYLGHCLSPMAFRPGEDLGRLMHIPMLILPYGRKLPLQFNLTKDLQLKRGSVTQREWVRKGWLRSSKSGCF
jgi:hypothetical protein